MLRRILGALALLTIFFGVAAAVEEFYPFEVATGQIRTPSENSGAPWFQDGATMYFGTGKDVSLSYNTTTNRLETVVPSDAGTSNAAGQIAIQTVGTSTIGPVVADADRLLDNDATSASAATYNTTFAAQPDYPRSVSITPNQAIWAEVMFTGTDITGVAITENITFSNTSAIKSTYRAFRTISRVDYNATKQGFGSTAPTFDVGISDKLGLNTKLATNTVLMAALDGTKEGTAPTVTVNATVISLNTADLQSAMNSKPVELWYII